MRVIGLQHGFRAKLPGWRRAAFLANYFTAFSAMLLATGTASAASEGADQNTSAAPVQASAQLIDSPLQPAAPDYSNSSHHELTRLGARWDSLSAPEREALLREVKLRMAQRKDADGVLVIRTQRRFGSVYSGNGRYLKIETKVIRVRPAERGAVPAGSTTRGFGTGFERRNAQPATRTEQAEGERESPSIEATLSPPMVQVSEPSS